MLIQASLTTSRQVLEQKVSLKEMLHHNCLCHKIHGADLLRSCSPKVSPTSPAWMAVTVSKFSQAPGLYPWSSHRSQYS